MCEIEIIPEPESSLEKDLRQNYDPTFHLVFKKYYIEKTHGFDNEEAKTRVDTIYGVVVTLNGLIEGKVIAETLDDYLALNLRQNLGFDAGKILQFHSRLNTYYEEHVFNHSIKHPELQTIEDYIIYCLNNRTEKKVDIMAAIEGLKFQQPAKVIDINQPD